METSMCSPSPVRRAHNTAARMANAAASPEPWSAMRRLEGTGTLPVSAGLVMAPA